MYYAQIDINGICFAVSDLAGLVDQVDMIQIDGYDTSLLGKRWNGVGWDQPEIEPTPDAPSTDQQLAEVRENQLILMDAIATLYETISGGE